MTAGNPITATAELRRWPFRRRPMAQPGTALVFQTSNGSLTHPASQALSGDVSLRGFRTMYTVNIRPQGASFRCKLPSKETALEFDATVAFTWLVQDPVAVVRQQVSDAAGECQAHLVRLLRKVSRRFEGIKAAEAEWTIADEVETPIRLTERGLEITAVSAEIKSDANVIDIEREKFHQTGQLGMHSERVEFFADILKRGGPAMSANILAQDPAKATEAASFMVGLWEKDQRIALDAMKIILDGEGIREGELDGAVLAVVERFRSIVTRTDAQVSPALLAGAAEEPRAIDAPAAASSEATPSTEEKAAREAS